MLFHADTPKFTFPTVGVARSKDVTGKHSCSSSLLILTVISLSMIFCVQPPSVPQHLGHASSAVWMTSRGISRHSAYQVT